MLQTSESDNSAPRFLTILSYLLPFLVYLILTLPLFDWLIDDAGISFAYARCLAQGQGLVAQPGAPPVEGYSNFLWVVLMSVFFLAKIFHVYITPKIISLLLIGMTFYFLHRIILRLTGGSLPTSFVTLFFLAINTSFIIWTCSGLENALYVMLITLLVYIQIRYVSQRNNPSSIPYWSGGLVAAAAMTRPDGIIYAAIFPAAVLLSLLGSYPKNLRQAALDIIKYTAVLGMIGGAFILFRYYYFGDLYPNTYYAKGGPSTSILIPALTLQEPYLTKFHQLMQSLFGTKLKFIIPLASIVVITLFYTRKKLWKEFTLILLTSFTAALIFIIMPVDWMGEFRFASPFFPLFYLLLGIMIWFILRRLITKIPLRIIIGSVLIISFGIVTFQVQLPRLTKFYKNPVVAFKNVANLYAHKFNRYADILGLQQGSVLLPDIGATLYYSNLQVFDLAALTDKTIAKTRKTDKPAFYNYVFDECKPTFIHMHGNWTVAARLDDDPRFRRDYIPINEYRDKWIEQKTGQVMMSGDFVRIDVIGGNDSLLNLLRNNEQ